MERRNRTVRVSGRRPAQQDERPARGPPNSDRQALIETFRAIDNDNLELSVENAFLVEQIVHLLRTHARRMDEVNKTTESLKKELKEYEDQKKENLEKMKEVISLLKTWDSLVLQMIEVQEFQMKELKNTEPASLDQPEGVRSEGNTQMEDALQQIQTDFIIKMNHLWKKVIEKDELISNLTGETKAQKNKLCSVSSELTLKQAELDQSIKKCNTLEQEFKKELAEQEERWETKQNEMEKLWLEREDTLIKSATKAEEELKHVIHQNIKLQKLVLEKGKKGFWAKKRQKSRNKEEVAGHAAQVGQEEEEDKEEEDKEKEKKRDKVKKWHLWRKKNQGEKSQQVEGAAGGSDQPGQEEKQAEVKPTTQGFPKWGRKKKENRAQSSEKEEEGAACPETGEQ